MTSSLASRFYRPRGRQLTAIVEVGDKQAEGSDRLRSVVRATRRELIQLIDAISSNGRWAEWKQARILKPEQARQVYSWLLEDGSADQDADRVPRYQHDTTSAPRTKAGVREQMHLGLFEVSPDGQKVLPEGIVAFLVKGTQAELDVLRTELEHRGHSASWSPERKRGPEEFFPDFPWLARPPRP